MRKRALRVTSADLAALVTQRMPLVRKIATRVARKVPRFVDLDDLVSAGVIGLIDAGKKFDKRIGSDFDAFAEFRIRGAMLDELRSRDALSRDMRRLHRDIRTATHALSARLMRQPDHGEVASAMGLTAEELSASYQKLAGWSVVGYDDAGEDFLSRVADVNGDDPFDNVARMETAAAIDAAAMALPDRTRAILALYYREGWNMRQIGESLGLTESRICQILGTAHAAMRDALTRAGVDGS